MAFVERLLPRHWDGRRLLQFLTGLALLALAFAVPAGAAAAPLPVSSVVSTTVDAPAAAPALVTSVAGTSAGASAAGPAAQTEHVSAAAVVPLAGAVGGWFVPVAAPVEAVVFAADECQGAWSSRGPPRA